MEQINDPVFARNLNSTFTSLRKLELNPVINTDSTLSFEFEGEHFYIKFKNSEVEIWDFEWLVLDAGGEDVAEFIEAIRYTNGKRFPTITVSFPDVKGKIKISSVYRFINTYSEDYPRILLGILSSFFDIRRLLGLVYADVISRKELGKPSNWELPKIGYVEGSNLRFDLSYYLSKIKTDDSTAGEDPTPESENHESETGRGEPEISEELIQKYSPEPDTRSAIKHWFDYFVKLGCQPVDMSDRSLLMLHYMGKIFSIYFEGEMVRIRLHNMFTFTAQDAMDLFCFQKAAMRPTTTPGPKIIVFEPDENGQSKVEAIYFLFSDFNFDEKNEFRNLRALKSIMDSFIEAQTNLLFHMHHIREHLLANNKN